MEISLNKAQSQKKVQLKFYTYLSYHTIQYVTQFKVDEAKILRLSTKIFLKMTCIPNFRLIYPHSTPNFPPLYTTQKNLC